MTHPHATFRLPSGVEIDVAPGGIIGRLPDAALTLDDPRVSEAHAMVSLRGGALVLLALRGRLRVGREEVTRVRLQAEIQVEVVPGLALRVASVSVPDSLLVLIDAAGVEVPLLGSIHAIPANPQDAIQSTYLAGAAAHLWPAGDGWRIQIGQEEPVPVVAGQEIEVAGRRLQVAARSTQEAGSAPTMAGPGGRSQITIVTRFETAHIHVEGGPSVVVPGIAARILTELAGYGAPVPWEMVARTIWKDADPFATRRNWDRHLALLRDRLRQAGVRDDLVRPDGRGNVELFLCPGDSVRDES